MFSQLIDFLGYAGDSDIDIVLVETACCAFILFICISYDLVSSLIKNLIRIKK